MTLEDFVREFRFRLYYTQHSETTITVRDRGRPKKTTEIGEWRCYIGSPFLGHSLYYERRSTPDNSCIGGSVPRGTGKTRKEAREDLLKRIRGVTLKTGVDRDYTAEVPVDLQ